MVSKNNSIYRFEHDTDAVQHFGLKKLNVGVASVLLGTTVGLGLMTGVSHADTVNSSSVPSAPVTAVTQNVATATPTTASQTQTTPSATFSNAQVPAPSQAPGTNVHNQVAVQQAPAVSQAPSAVYGANLTQQQAPATTQYSQQTSNTGAQQTYAQPQAPAVSQAPASRAVDNVNAASKLETNTLNVQSATNAYKQTIANQNGQTTNGPVKDQKMESWNVSIGYKFATKDYTGDNGITVYAVPSKNGTDGAQPTHVKINVIARTGHNELGVDEDGNTSAGKPTINFIKEYDGTRDVNDQDHAEIIKGNVKGHHYTVYRVTVPLQTNFGWKYQQPTNYFYADVTLDHVNNGVTIDQSRDINDTVDIYEYRDHLKFHYVSKDGKINKTVDGPTVTSTGGRVNLNYDIPEGYKLANSDQVAAVEFGPRSDNPNMPAESHYGEDGWPANPTSPNETTIEVPLDLAAIKSSWTGQFVDADNNNAEVGNPVVINGNSGDKEDVKMTVPQNYELVPGQKIPTSVTLTDQPIGQTIAVRHRHELIPENSPLADKYGLTDTITRTINVHNPDDSVRHVTQSAKLTRSVDIDLVNGHKVYTDWTTGNWDEFTTPTVTNYTPSRASVPAQKVTHDDKNQTIDITYNQDQGSWTGQFVDNDNGGKPVGDPTVLTGGAGNHTKPGIKIPDGYKLASNAQLPTDITFGDKPVTVKIPLVHKTHTVHPGDSDAGQYALSYDATRTINFKGLDGVKNAPKNELQKATVTRTAVVDDVTHKALSYSPWSRSAWKAYDAPTVKGYKATPTALPEVTVTDQTKDTTATINYVKQTSWTGQFVDKDNNMSPVGKPVVVSGDAGSNHGITMNIPDNYELVPGQKIPSQVTLGNDDITAQIQLQHKHKQVKPGDPDADKYGVSRTMTRTIIMHNPDGKNGQEVQTVDLGRVADVDLVTDKATYTAWSEGDWPAFTAPTIKDYKANPTGVPAAHVTSDTKSTVVDIYYKNDQGIWTGHFVDNDEGGKVIGDPTVITGENGQTKDVHMNIPDGYELAKGQQIPSQVTLTDQAQTATIGLVHKHEIVNAGDPDAKKYNLDLKKAVTRTIVFKGLDDKKDPVIQKVVLLRSADVDLVTKQAKYTDWSTDEWPQFAIPQVDGYTADKASVDAAKVDGNTQDQIVAITYTKNAPESQAPSEQPASEKPASEAPSEQPASEAPSEQPVSEAPIEAPASTVTPAVPAQQVAQPETVAAPATVATTPVAATVAAPAAAPSAATTSAPAQAALPQTGNSRMVAMGAMALGLATLGLGAGLLEKKRA